MGQAYVRHDMQLLLLPVLGERCLRNRPRRRILHLQPPDRRKERKMLLFPVTEPLEFIAVDITGFFPKTKSINQYIAVMTDWLSKLAEATTMTKTSPRAIATISFGAVGQHLSHWNRSCNGKRTIIDNQIFLHATYTTWRKADREY